MRGEESGKRARLAVSDDQDVGIRMSGLGCRRGTLNKIRMCVLARSEIHLFSHSLSFVCVLLALRVCAVCLLRGCCVCVCCGGWVVWCVCVCARALCAPRRAPVAPPTSIAPIRTLQSRQRSLELHAGEARCVALQAGGGGRHALPAAAIGLPRTSAPFTQSNSRPSPPAQSQAR